MRRFVDGQMLKTTKLLLQRYAAAGRPEKQKRPRCWNTESVK
nr:MAG TPA: hypothetical protein [Caudoviricetes sp.]DAZ08985.1 MAG TPA: hypothetical protein [Caudoviricetes sp.]